MKNPLLWLASCFALGIVVVRPGQSGQFLAVHSARSIPFTLLAGSLCLLAGLIALRQCWQRTAAGLALTGFVFAGATAAMLFEFRFPPDHASRLADSDLSAPISIEGRLATTPIRTAYGLQFDLELAAVQSGGRNNRGSDRDAPSVGTASGRRASGKIRLRLEASGDAAHSADSADSTSWAAIDALRLERGDVIRAVARLRRPRVYKNPGSFDFRRWMESIEDVYLVGTIVSPSQVERLASPPSRVGEPPGWWHAAIIGMMRSIENTRRRLLGTIDGLYPPWLPEGRDGSVLKAVLLGDRSSLDSDTLESFRKAGLYHLLVIAGLHVGLLAMLVAALLRWLGLRSTARSLLVLMFLLGYASLVEQRAPTLRATLMISIFFVARLLYRERSLLNAVGLAALALLLTRPAWLFESGFQLSFAAALLIAGLAVPILERTTEPYRRGLRRLDVVELDPSLEPRVAQLRLDLRRLVEWLKARFPFLNRHQRLAAALVVAPAQAAIWTGNILLFSAILQLGLLLPMAETFHRVTYAGVGLNAVAIPVMTVLLALAVPTVLLATFAPGIAAGPTRVLALVMKALFALTRLPHLPAWLSYRVPEPPVWVAWGFAVSATAAAWALSASGKSDDDTTPPARRGCEELNTEARRHREENEEHMKVSFISRRFPFFSVPLSLCGGSSLAIISRLRRRSIFWASLGTLAVFAVLVSAHPFPPRLPGGGVEVTALDCDGGDALFLVLPDGRTMLVDAGAGRGPGGPGGLGERDGAFQRGRWDPGEDIVSPYLWSRGIKSFDVLVVTDTRDDHLGGVAAVIRNFRVGELWRAARGSASYGPAYGEVFNEAYRQGIRVRELAGGDSIALGQASAKVLWPPLAIGGGYYVGQTDAPRGAPMGDGRAGAGADSLALRISARGVNLLLPGEMSGGVEKKLVGSGVTLASDLLKVARHGAKTSTTGEFLARVAPQIALITAAGASARSSPNPETLDRLRTAGVQVFRTDLDGTITVTWPAGGSSRENVPAVRCYSRSKAR